MHEKILERSSHAAKQIKSRNRLHKLILDYFISPLATLIVNYDLPLFDYDAFDEEYYFQVYFMDKSANFFAPQTVIDYSPETKNWYKEHLMGQSHLLLYGPGCNRPRCWDNFHGCSCDRPLNAAYFAEKNRKRKRETSLC